MTKKKVLNYAGIVLLTLTIVSAYFTNARAQAGKSANHMDSLLDSFDVKWNTPGPTSAQSMPIGNGDIGLNVWVEKSGDLVFYISKTDAWGGELEQQKDPWMKQGGVLMKLGAIRVSLSPGPLAKDSSFKQLLKLRNGEIWVQEGVGKNAVKLRVWVDANHPVIRIEAQGGSPVTVNVKLDNWRAGLTDTVLEDRKNQLAWYHHNSATTDPHLANLTFGAIVKGNGLVNKDATTLQSGRAVTAQLISIYPLTTVSGSGSQWLSKLEQQINENEKLNIEKTRVAHQQWWQQFWQRSWIFLGGDDLANHVTQGYILQRFVTACAGRGAYPIKFNGSIFVVDNPAWKPNRNAPPKKWMPISGRGVGNTGFKIHAPCIGQGSWPVILT